MRHFHDWCRIAVAFPCSTVVSLSRVGKPSHCFSSSDFLSYHYTVLLSSFTWPVYAPLGVSVYFPVFLGSFMFEFFLQFSPFVAQIKNIFSDQGFHLLNVFANDISPGHKEPTD